MAPGKEHPDTFATRTPVSPGGVNCVGFLLRKLEDRGLTTVSRLPYCIRILLENLLRNEDGRTVEAADIEAAARWTPGRLPPREVAFSPGRILLQDLTGVPVLADLATMRDAAARFGVNPARINPVIPVDLVIDHSLQVDVAGRAGAPAANVELEYRRNRERYSFIRWGQRALGNLRVVPPSAGIVHQVNLEHLATVVTTTASGGEAVAFPDTVLGTDSHTTMVNGLGVLGWGVGGIEAEAAMLGYPVTLTLPEVVGVQLTGALRRGATATDLALTVTEALRKHGVVGKFVEFFGDGAASLSVADRTTVANMAPEYGATTGYFPPDEEVLKYLALTGRAPAHIAVVEAYLKEQGLFRSRGDPAPRYTSVVKIKLGKVEPCLAGPKRPHDRIPLGRARKEFVRALTGDPRKGGFGIPEGERGKRAPVKIDGTDAVLSHGSVVIAAITSCTNTSNPSLMIAAGLLARNAVARGLTVGPAVKASFTPGSRVVVDYLAAAGLIRPLEALRFHVAGYGCATCIGNSGPLPEPVSSAIEDEGLIAAAVLSGNRNFEGRIHPLTRANYLASPPLVIAYALAGTMDIDLERDPLGAGRDGTGVFLRDIMPDPAEVARISADAIQPGSFRARYAEALAGDAAWNGLPSSGGALFAWQPSSTYLKRSPYLDDAAREAPALADISGARALALLGDSVTTDHISPAGAIAAESPAGRYLVAHGIDPRDFNSYGSRRGNHEVMVRGTFANPRLRNLLVPGAEGGRTVCLLDDAEMSIYDAAQSYRKAGVPLVIIAGKEYGSGSSRDWAAKGTSLLGVRAVIAESYERIHRGNLVQMGVLPLQFLPGENHGNLGLTGRETFSVSGIAAGLAPRRRIKVEVRRKDAPAWRFTAIARLDTKAELEYYRHGGILPAVLRSLAETSA